MTSPTLVSVGTRATATTGTTITPALPTGLNAGDLLVAVVSIKSNAAISTPAGWTQLQQTNSGASFTTAVYWRLWQSGDAAVAYSWTGSVNNEAQILRITGADATTPIGTVGAIATGTASPHTSVGFSSSVNNTMAVLIDAAAAATSLTNPTGWTAKAGGASNVAELTFASLALATAGTSSGNTSSTGAAAAWTQQQIEIRPYVNVPGMKLSGTPVGDGNSGTNAWGASPGLISALTTITDKNLIVVAVSIESTATTHATVSSITATGLTFTRRSSVYLDNHTGSGGSSPTWDMLEVWSAQQAAAGSTGTVTVNWSGGTKDIGDAVLFAVNYDGINYPVWSANASDPATLTSTGTSAPSLSTAASNTDAMILGFAMTTFGGGAMAVGAGFTLIKNILDGSGTFNDSILAEYKLVTGANSGVTVASSTSVLTWSLIGDAIEPPPGASVKFAPLRQYLRR